MRVSTPDQRSATPAAPAPPASAAVRLPSWAFPLVTVVSLIIGATSVVRGTRGVVTIADSDLTNFFLKSADYILRGDPWHMYAVRALGGYPNYNPPLTMFLLAPLLGLARMFGFAANYGEQITFVTLPFIFLVPVMGALGLRVMRALYPEAPETLRLLLYAFITLSPLTWQSYSIWYHVEQPLMLCLMLASVLALQARREGLAGLLAGLAFLSRTTALIPLIALGLLLLLTREWRPLLKFGGVSALIAGLGFAPFFLFDAADAKYTFISWRGGAPIGSDSIWTIFAYTGTSSHIRELINAGAKRLDMYTVMLVVAVAAYFAVRRLRLTLYMRDVWALLAIAMLATPMLSKQVWPYYYLEPFVFIVVWELSTLQDRVAGVWRWPVLSIAFSVVAATLSQYVGLQSVGRLDALTVGVTQTALMAGFAWGVWKRIEARKPAADAASMGGADAAHAGMPPMTPPGMAVAGAAGMAAGQMARQRPQPSPEPAPSPDGRAGRNAGVRPPSAPAPQPQGDRWQAPQPGPQQPGPQPGPRAGSSPVPPAWPPAAPMGGATPPRGQNALPGAMNPASPVGPATPLWPGEVGNQGRGAPPVAPAMPAQEWRAPSPPAAPSAPAPSGQQPQQPPQPMRAPGRLEQRPGRPPERSPEQPATGTIDPWRDWPQGR